MVSIKIPQYTDLKINFQEEEYVFFYCSVQSGLEILKSGSLFMSDPFHMNDGKEIFQSIELLRKYLEIERTNKEYYLFRMIIGILTDGNIISSDVKADELAKIKLDKFIRYISSLSEMIRVFPNTSVFITCFSKDSDKLSQWFKYGDGGRGIALGFSISSIKETIKMKDPNSFDFNDITYVNDVRDYNEFAKCHEKEKLEVELKKCSQIVMYILKDVYSNSKSSILYYMDDSGEITKIDDSAMLQSICNNIKAYLSSEDGENSFPGVLLSPTAIKNLSFIKSSAWEEESETRLIYYLNDEKSLCNKFIRTANHDGGQVYIPYILYNFPMSSLRKIIIGPQCKLTDTNLQQMFNIIGNSCHEIIQESLKKSADEDAEVEKNGNNSIVYKPNRIIYKSYEIIVEKSKADLR